jgi:hypothetical protein
LRIMRTHSAASVMADDVTSIGCTTLASNMSVIVPCERQGFMLNEWVRHVSSHDSMW